MTTTDTAPLSARLRDRANDILDHMPSNLLVVAADALDALSARVEELEAEINRQSDNHAAELIEIGAAAGEDLRQHGANLLHYSTVVAVKRLRDEANGLADSIDEAWEAFGTAGNRRVITLAEQISAADRDAEARATQAEAREAGLREALRRARPLVALFADERRWEDHQPDGPGTEHGWYLNVSEAGCPAATDTAAAALSAIDAALSPAQPAQDRRILAPWNPCLAKLKDGEPFFVLLGRDEQAAAATRHWATLRELERGPSDKTASAYRLADDMDRYRAGLLTTETTEGRNG